MESLLQQHLVLIHRHRQEWKTFFVTQIALRRSLSCRHKKERANLISIQKSPYENAKVIDQQTCEIMEFRVVYLEKKRCILEDQNKAIFALKSLLKRRKPA